jgi:betaine-aldehyde dehydrogenase
MGTDLASTDATDFTYEQLYVGGRWADPASASVYVVRSPHDGSPVGRAPVATAADVDRCVAAARAAFDEGPWPRLPAADRIAALTPLLAAYAARCDELAALISRENGSPLTFSQLGQVGAIPPMVQGFLDAAAATAWEEELPGAFGTSRLWREPVGVVAAITAWNVPQVLIVAKLVPALLAGCTVVVKPPAETALDGLVLAELIDGLGLPEGVVSIVPGGPEAGERLVGHPDVDKVAFTGSTAVGRRIGAVCGGQCKRVSLELGGKSAAIVLDDADPERTAKGLRFASFVNNGQACAAQTRVLAPRSRYADVVEALAAAVSSFVVGDPLDPATEIGPLVSRQQQARVLDYVRLGRDEGGRVVVGDAPLPPGLAGGNYVAPTVFADVDNAMRIAREEIFGPVLVVIPYDDEDDAVRLANDSPYGLGGSVWTADTAHGLDLARRIRTGTFGVNRYGPDPATPFGGYKASGLGREYGRAGLDAFVELKCVHGA